MKSRMGVALALAILTSLASCQSSPFSSQAEHSDVQEVDLLIEGGTIHDGSGASATTGVIAINNGLIVAVGDKDPSSFRAKRTINADGLVVAPGFIDPHTHAGSDLKSTNQSRRANLPYLMQGVTTVIVGNDGYGDADVATLVRGARENGIGSNVAYLVGFGHIRKSVMQDDNRSPTRAELTEMKALVKQAMCGGAIGFSAGLYYTPQNFAQTDEVISLARIAAEYGGYYDTHIRDESDYSVGLNSALDEAISIGRKANMPVNISHIKALGPSVWGQSAAMIDAINAARAMGIRVTADQYPWTASGTRISNALVPRWALDGGLDGLRKRLAEPEVFARIRKEMEANLRRRGGPKKLLLTGNLGNAKAGLGKTLGDYAAMRREEPLDAALAILREGDARVASFVMNADDIAAFAKQSWVMTGSDGSNGHPRKYASYPKAYRDFVIDQQIMSLARFIQRSSGQVADMAGLKRRGYLKAGYFADALVFDPATFKPLADFQNPRELSQGVRYLIVNGVLTIDKGQYTGALGGTPLFKEETAQNSKCK